jgi:hypothetical protein
MAGMRFLKFAALAALAAPVLVPLAAHAQSTRYDVKTINFDLWCQEQAKLPPDRCDKRTPEDEKTFEAYRDKIEKYEIPYLQHKQDEQQLNRTIIHDQPLESPVHQDNNRQGDDPTPESGKPQ